MQKTVDMNLAPFLVFCGHLERELQVASFRIFMEISKNLTALCAFK